MEVWVQDGRLKIILLLEIRSQEVEALAIHLQSSLGDKFFKERIYLVNNKFLLTKLILTR